MYRNIFMLSVYIEHYIKVVHFILFLGILTKD